jgi:hypothetical protein
MYGGTEPGVPCMRSFMLYSLMNASFCWQSELLHFELATRLRERFNHLQYIV